MDSRQELVEEAAQAMANAPHAASWDAHTKDERNWYRKDAAIALAVFDKAHAPTDDEREVLGQMIADHLTGFPGARPDEDDLEMADLILAAGFHRSQDEPTGARVEVAARVLFGATVDSMLVARELANIALRAAGRVR